MSSAGVNGPAHGRAVRRKAKPTISFCRTTARKGGLFICTPKMSAAMSFAQDHNLAREGPAVLAIVRRKFHSVIFQRKIITDKLGCMCKKVGGIGSRNKAVALVLIEKLNNANCARCVGHGLFSRKPIAPHIAQVPGAAILLAIFADNTPAVSSRLMGIDKLATMGCRHQRWAA